MIVVVVVVLSSGKIRCHTGVKHKSILCRKRNKLPDTKPNMQVKFKNLNISIYKLKQEPSHEKTWEN